MRKARVKGLGLLIITMSWVGCQKDQQNETQAVQTPQQLAMELTKEAFQQLGDRSNEERSLFFRQQHEKLDALEHQRYKGTSSDEPLGDAFIALEGIVNNLYVNELETSPEWVITSESVAMDISESNGAYYVTNADYQAAYTSLHNSVADYLQDHSDEYFIMADLTIDEINPAGGYALIAMQLYTAPLQPGGPVQYYTPATAWLAADKAGRCTTGGTIDAADFIRSYANNTAPWKIRCQGKQIYLNPGTFAGTDVFGGGYDQTHLYWHGNTNECLGNTNEEWYHWYDLIDQLTAHIDQQYFTGHPSEEFFLTHYHSQEQNNGNKNPHIQHKYFHGGKYVSAIISCP